MSEPLDLAAIRHRAQAGRDAAVQLANSGDIMRSLAGTCADLLHVLDLQNRMAAEFQTRERSLRAEIQSKTAEAEGYKQQWAARAGYVDQLERDNSELVGTQAATRQKILDLHLALKNVGAGELAQRAYSIIS